VTNPWRMAPSRKPSHFNRIKLSRTGVALTRRWSAISLMTKGSPRPKRKSEIWRSYNLKLLIT
jgi:hypothetical protein